MTSVLGRRHITDHSSKAVKYTPCAKGDHTDEEELDEISVVIQDERQTGSAEEDDDSAAGPTAAAATAATATRETPDSLAVDEDAEQGPSGDNGITANGPRVLPGVGIYPASTDRTHLIGERLSSAGRIQQHPAPPPPSGGGVAMAEQRCRSTSKHSLFDLVTYKIDSVKGRKSKAFVNAGELGYVNKAHTADPLTPRQIRRVRRKELQEKFGTKGRNSFLEKLETSTNSSMKEGCKWTFVFDPSGRFAYWWSAILSVAFLYNFWVLIYRFAFEEINASNMAIWFTLDYSADFLYVLDVVFHFRTGFLEDGVLQTDGTKLRIHYMNSTLFYIDCLCLLPLDFLYLSIGFKSMLRCFRLVKIYRFWAFLDRTERHTNYPNVVRTITLLHYLFAIYHWNACVMYIITRHLVNENWNHPARDADVLIKYLHSLYWSTLTLTTIGDLPRPSSKGEYIFVIVEFVFGLLLFSTILGHVANIVTGISAARRDFQAKLDCVKTYMTLRRVPVRLQDRVIRWFDYLWLSKKSSNEDHTLGLLPDKLKGEIALHVHLDTLKRVEIFQNTEAGFLCELVLRLRPVLFSPGDYICRKGEVGKEMYIVNRGRLQVVGDNGKTVLATLRPGSYFGEISILNMGSAGNRRTASVRSVGYSDLFCLSKKDLWEVLKDYPTARVRLEAIAVKRLEKYKKAPIEKAALPRSRSTPGMLETTGKIPLQAMLISRHNTLPAGMLTPRTSSQGSACTSHSHPEDMCSSYAGPGSHHSGGSLVEPDDGDLTALNQAASADITNSMTVSSITSYITESSAQKSPTAAEPPPPPRSATISPATSPRVTSAHTYSATSLPQGLSPAQSPFIPIETGSSTQGPSAVPYRTSPLTGRDLTSPGLHGAAHPAHQMQQQQQQQQQQQYQQQQQQQPGVQYAFTMAPSLTTIPQDGVTSGHVSPFQTLYGAANAGPILLPSGPLPPAGPPAYSTSTVPCFSGTSVSPGQLSSSSQSGTPGGFGGASSPYLLANAGSTGSIGAFDQTHDVLLQEITRLRERLQTLETENASMNMKLNQKHYEVDNRLMEIEMHLCASDDTGSSADEKGSGTVSKESVI